MNKPLLTTTIIAFVVVVSLILKIDQFEHNEILMIKQAESDSLDVIYYKGEARFWAEEALCLDQEFQQSHLRIKKYIRRSHKYLLK